MKEGIEISLYKGVGTFELYAVFLLFMWITYNLCKNQFLLFGSHGESPMNFDFVKLKVCCFYSLYLCILQSLLEKGICEKENARYLKNFPKNFPNFTCYLLIGYRAIK